jgi:hypothetical protein
VPEPYLGTWTATIANATGNNTRTLIVSQGKTGKAALTLTADGPTAEGGYYHCVFAAILTPAPSTDDRLHFGPSTVISGDPSYCKAGMASTLTLHNDNQLQRTTDTDEQTITYTRAR